MYLAIKGPNKDSLFFKSKISPGGIFLKNFWRLTNEEEIKKATNSGQDLETIYI